MDNQQNTDNQENVDIKKIGDNQVDNQQNLDNQQNMESDSSTVVEVVSQVDNVQGNVVAETQLVDSDTELVIDESTQVNRKRDLSTSPTRDRSR